MFASRINAKLDTYVSWKPDPHSIAIDAFTFPWDFSLIYCFPPFSIVWRTVEKILRDKVEAVLIVPLWPTQSWYPCLMKMITDYPLVFSANQLLLQNKPQEKHPLHYKLKLAALRLSGDPLQNIEFVKRVRTLSWKRTRKRYAPTIKKWYTFCIAQNIDPIHPPIGMVLNFLVQRYKEGGGATGSYVWPGQP